MAEGAKQVNIAPDLLTDLPCAHRNKEPGTRELVVPSEGNEACRKGYGESYPLYSTVPGKPVRRKDRDNGACKKGSCAKIISGDMKRKKGL